MDVTAKLTWLPVFNISDENKAEFFLIKILQTWIMTKDVEVIQTQFLNLEFPNFEFSSFNVPYNNGK